MSRRSGVLITLEGCDGCGKSTQAALLCERLAACGLPVGPSSAPGAVIREPGGTPAGEAVRELLLHGPGALAPWTEALLYAAARAELVERVLLPELGAGRILVLDRFVDSSLAYQGFARGLGVDAVRPSTSRGCAVSGPTSRSSSTSTPPSGWRVPATPPTASRPRVWASNSAWPPGSPWSPGASRSGCASSTAFATWASSRRTSRPPALEAVADAGLRLGG